MTRRPLIAGNWKMNLTVPEAEDLVRKLVGGLPGDLHQRVDVAVLPPFPLLAAVRAVLSTEDPFIMSGAQDLSPHDKGAHTGDVSGPMLCSVGCRYVTVGHSERRTDHAEDDAQVELDRSGTGTHRLGHRTAEDAGHGEAVIEEHQVEAALFQRAPELLVVARRQEAVLGGRMAPRPRVHRGVASLHEGDQRHPARLCRAHHMRHSAETGVAPTATFVLAIRLR